MNGLVAVGGGKGGGAHIIRHIHGKCIVHAGTGVHQFVYNNEGGKLVFLENVIPMVVHADLGIAPVGCDGTSDADHIARLRTNRVCRRAVRGERARGVLHVDAVLTFVGGKGNVVYLNVFVDQLVGIFFNLCHSQHLGRHRFRLTDFFHHFHIAHFGQAVEGD